MARGGHRGRPAVHHTFAALADAIRECQEAGLTRTTGDPAHLAAHVWASLQGLALPRLNAPGFPWPAPLDDMATFAVSQLVGLSSTDLNQDTAKKPS